MCLIIIVVRLLSLLLNYCYYITFISLLMLHVHMVCYMIIIITIIVNLYDGMKNPILSEAKLENCSMSLFLLYTSLQGKKGQMYNNALLQTSNVSLSRK